MHSLTAVILYVWLKTVIELFLLLPFLEPFSRVHNSISITTVKYTFFLQRIQIFFALKLDRSENHFVFSLMEINNFRACNHFLFPFFQKRIRGDSVKMKETITILKKYQIWEPIALVYTSLISAIQCLRFQLALSICARRPPIKVNNNHIQMVKKKKIKKSNS